MRYVSIDIETTGLDHEENQMIEFAAIIEDSNNPLSYEVSKKYRRIVLASDRKYVCSSFAAKMNAELIETISDVENGVDVQFLNNPNLSQYVVFENQLIGDFKTWLLFNGFIENKKGVVEVVVAGKNFGSFDKNFIEATPDFETYGLKFHYRPIDPMVNFIDWVNDTIPPSTDICKKRAGLTGKVKHEALSDAWDIIELLRIRYLLIAIPAKAPIAA